MTEGEAFAWAVGLFEGEGSISVTVSGGRLPTSPRYVHLALGSTDEDVVRRFHAIVGCGTVNGPHRRAQPHHKPRWIWNASGRPGLDLLDAMLPFLGERRRARAAEVRGMVAQAACA